VHTFQDYLPPSLAPTILSWLSFLHIIPSSSPAAATSEATVNARNAHNTAVNTLNTAERELKETRDALDKLETGGHFGKDGEWKKLDGTCLEKNTGDYTYSVCLFGSATQKSNKDHGSHSLGYLFLLGLFQLPILTLPCVDASLAGVTRKV
jgi:protein kinase C substrate 80K-H